MVGTTLAGRYDLLELLGTGGMGDVYQALDRELDEVVALKVIRDELASLPGIVERFRTEVKLARRVTHANVARTFELGRDGSLLFCTMELISGESLRRRLERSRGLPVGVAVTIACEVCDGLIAAHEANVVHRDIKPENVMLSTCGRVVITDFGIASVAIADGDRAGTPAYMAPEQARGEPVRPAADVYAVGVMLYEMVSGRAVFERDGEDTRSTGRLRVPPLEHLPEDLATLIERATDPDVDARIASAEELRGLLARWMPEVAAGVTRELTRTRLLGRELTNVFVSAPQGSSSKLYIAEAVHAELLNRLGQTPRVRVEAQRSESPVDATVELRVAEELAITITPEHAPPLVLRFPLLVEHLDAVIESAAAAIITAIARPAIPAAALDPLLRARHRGQSDISRLGAAADLLEEAALLAPSTPAIEAALASAKLYRVFFHEDQDPQDLVRAVELVRRALADAPHLADSHLAAGQLELHTGSSALAAAHFRIAIARAPYGAMAHDQLGRMLMEAGYVDLGLARLHEAMAIVPNMRSARQEIVRVRALLGHWEDHDAFVQDLLRAGENPLLFQSRFLVLRADPVYARQLRELHATSGWPFHPELLDHLSAVVCDGAWPTVRGRLLEVALDNKSTSRRRQALAAQLVAEAAGFAGDEVTCERMIDHAIDRGLFDLLWLERCAVLACVRSRSRFAQQRARVEERAVGILDALYGDHPLQPADPTESAPHRTRQSTVREARPRR